MNEFADARQGATEHTLAANRKLLDELPFEDRQDFADAERGFVAPLPNDGVVDGPLEGIPAWQANRFNFIEDGSPAPDTVNPSLWRHSQLVRKGGLFQVVERMYQVRNIDVSNLTIVEGDTGLIVFDPLTTAETAAAAMELYFEHRPRKPVVAVVHSHSHIDHYGGVKGVVSEQDVRAGKVKIVAPVGFLEAAVSENVFAGNAMSRRAPYMFGHMLQADAKGQVGAGIGMSTALGTVTLIPPTHEITETGQKMVIDGLTFEFLLAPDSEAPAEMHWFIEELGALTAAENCCHTLHNTYTPRGAPIRDPQAWSQYLNETIDRWGERVEVLYGMHHWPVWGRDRALEMLRKGRDGYRYINDQTLRLANHGHTPVEIAELVEMPPELAKHWAMRSYYGTVNHNVKATYVKYLGWYDGNPAHLHEHPPEQAAKRYVEYMGGAEAVLAKAREAFDAGDYRWVAEVVNHVVFADPANAEARELQARTLEQMGYQSESGAWRNSFLTAAQELRHGPLNLPLPIAAGSASADTVRAMSPAMLFNYMGVRLNGPKAAGKQLRINFEFTDVGEQAVAELANGSLNHSIGRADLDADTTIRLERAVFDRLVIGESSPADELRAGTLAADPGIGPLEQLFSLLDEFEYWFKIVEP